MAIRAFILLVAMLVTSLASGQVSVTLETSTRRAYIGQTIVIEIKVRGGEIDATPRLEVPGMTVGEPSVGRQSSFVFDGRTQRQESTISIRYGAIASAAGTVTVPPVQVRVEGRAYTTNGVTLNIVEPPKSLRSIKVPHPVQLKVAGMLSPRRNFLLHEGQWMTWDMRWILTYGTGRQPPLWDPLANSKSPILLIAGALDSKYIELNTRLADHCATARCHVIPDAGHSVHIEQPAQFRRVVDDFLAGHQE